MQIEESSINGILQIRPKIFKDERGYFVETWQKNRYQEIGINYDFVQDNHSQSVRRTLRGLHFQKKFPQGKLVMVIEGSIFDVAVDIRPKSKTFGKWFGTVLSEKNQNQLWIPPGFAHGFVVLSEKAHFLYKCTDFYHPNDEGSIRWNDPTLDIHWPIDFEPLLSLKDKEAPLFKEIDFSSLSFEK